MISAKVRAQYSTYRGQTLIPSNVCCRCNAVADPGTSARWELDEDGDRMCRECEKKEAN